MEEDDTEQTLFRRTPNQRSRDGCRMCQDKYRKFINTCLAWELVLLVVHILIFLILIFKWVKDRKLDDENKKLFRTFESGGHFFQGVLFVLLIVPFRFNKRIIKWIYNFSMKNETHMDECRQQPYQRPYADIEENKRGNYSSNEEDGDEGVSEKGSKRNSGMNTTLGSFSDNNIDHGVVSGRAVNNQAVVEHFSDASEIGTGKRDGNGQFIHIGYTNSARGGNGMDHQNGNAGKTTSGERVTMNRRKKGSNCSSGSLHRGNTNRKIPLCESFMNSLVFPVNTPKHTREKIRYFFLCAKLYAKKKISFLFLLKYACSFILMFAYPLYNLVKRKFFREIFYKSSYYMNGFDFAAGLLTGFLFVLVYGVVKFFASFYMNRKNEKFYFFDNYPFLGEVKCLCDENVRIITHNNPHLKDMAIEYLNAYAIYKTFLLKGILIQFLLCICAFAFTFMSMNTSVSVKG
ncbi:Uncharacterized protein PCOAH_00014710 [Plasmodium coatneyi]|uniref:Uncharacterized protein n=1 Tax=Plasmodium coatneyi TaxID=208452 RepID=A0A1B1DWR8_9APIC|nr:Uncharacterized protein PCOAH_00014710 [Plasmodium coatneyi]ANQ07047.1 Uncharacterized protein PCOAH_00014710 [Plasmodium coatneyi]